MASPSWYWTLIQLKPSGGYATQAIAAARLGFQQQFPDLASPTRLESGDDKLIQRQLMGWLEDVAAPPGPETKPEPSQAEQCLRCYISHQILQVCIDLQAKFGQDHGFALNDLLGFVLNDVDLTQPFPTAKEDAYRPFAAEILTTFKPQVGSLSTWASMLTRQHPELNDFLLEHGILQQSSWALLNEKSPDDLRRILADTYNLPGFEIEQACQLLGSYHAVYRRDRRGSRGKCKPPTEPQLAEIQRRSGLALTPAAVLAKLVELADYLRQQRLLSKGVLPASSIDDEALGPAIEAQVSQADMAGTLGDRDSTQQLYDLVNTCLDQAINTAIDQRLTYLQKQSADKAKAYRLALKLYCCEQRTMAEIAAAVGLEAQYQVTRLLKIDDLLANIRRQLLQQLQTNLLALMQTEQLSHGYVGADRLQTLDETCLAAIVEKPRANAAGNEFFSQRLCSVIQRI
ncbi:hypothetical protein C7293_04155 [filamentous cyanobacterium CCT1]|nr:hypothetical protein C7293_04155 [filamentous cyanobacterium CCT1]PSN80218.1 hypothetical protein C8B47_07670 [filamentous cyanobacterium CCP4]